MRSCLLCCTLAVVSMHAAFAITDWKDIGPANAVTVQITCHPTKPDVLFYVADSGHVYRSLDKGRTYHRVSQRVALAVQPFRQLRSGQHSVAIDPRPEHGHVVYYSPGSPGGGLWRSEKLGEFMSWVRVGNKNLGQSVVAVNYKGHVICLTLQKKVVISRDMGATWETVNSNFPFHFEYKRWVSACNYKADIAIGKHNTLYLCDRKEAGGIWVSSNSGRTWENRIKGKWFVDLCASPTEPGVALAFGREGEVYRSEDGGETWQQSSVLKSNDGGQTWKESKVIRHSYWKPTTWPMHNGGVAINHKGVAIAVGRWQMGISTDGGKTFKVRNEADIPWKMGDFVHERRVHMNLKCCSITASPEDKLWFFGDGQVVKKSLDDGQSWFGATTGLHGLWVYGQPCVDMTDPKMFHVANVDAGHSYTPDHGKTWIQSKPTPKPESCMGVAQDPNNPNIFYKAHGYGLIRFYKSTDSGKTFRQVGKIKQPRKGNIGYVLVDPSDSNRIYYTQRGGAGVYRSDNGGKTFKVVYKYDGICYAHITKKGNVYFHAWKGKGLFRYIKEEDKWDEITGNRDVDGFAVHPEDENIVYFSSGSYPEYARGALLKTSNALKSDREWEELGKYGGMHLYIDPYKPQYMLMMTNQKNVGMMYSSDSGKNWKSIHNNHATSFIWGFVAGGPKAKGRVYTYDSVACYIDDLYNPEYTGPEYK